MKYSGAYYDYVTDTIHNCKPYSYEWFHEQRHRVQYKNLKFLPYMSVHLHILTQGFMTAIIPFVFFIPFTLWLGFVTMLIMPWALQIALLEFDALIMGTVYWLKHTLKGYYRQT